MNDKTTEQAADPKQPEQAAAPALTEADLANASSDAKAEERQRISGILGSEEAEGREDQAKHIAFNTDMSAEDAVSLMAASEKKSEQSRANALDLAMANEENPDLTEDGGASDDEDAARASAVAEYKKRRGR